MPKLPGYKSLSGIEGWKLAATTIRRLLRMNGGHVTDATLYWLSTMDFHCAVSRSSNTVLIVPDNLYTAISLIHLNSLLKGWGSIDDIADPWCNRFPTYFPNNAITTSSDNEDFLLSYTSGALLINEEESNASSYTITATI